MSGMGPVHTTGINLASVLTIVSAVVVIMTAILGVTARYITARITGAIDRFRIEAFDPLAERVSELEVRQGVRRPRRRV
jgi:hypothetical protein